MSPYEQARKVYTLEPCARTFDEDLEAHFINGFVFSRPDYFIMGRPVMSTALPELITNPWHRFHSVTCDCWHVYLMAGNMARAWDILPWPLPLYSMERKNELRFYRAEVMKRLTGL